MPINNFSKKVLQIVAEIPVGKTMSYKDVAISAGNPLAYRAVGNILNNNYNKGNHDIPCYRVVRSDGKSGGYAGGKTKKILLLKKEGIVYI